VKRGLLGAALALAIALLIAPQANAQAFVFSAIPDQDESRLRERFDKVAAWLGRELGREVKYVPVKSYPAAVTAFRNNQVQMAWFGGLSGVQARLLVPGSEALAQGAEDKEFISYLIANTATKLNASDAFPAGLAGKSFTYGAKTSTSGRLMPEYYLRQHLKADPEKVFSRVGFSGDHSATIALVQAGSYDVGAVNFTVWEDELKAGKIDPAKVRVIWKTPPYPDYQWTIRGDVDAVYGKGFKEKVRKTLLGLKDPEILAAFPRSKFIPAANADYEPILRVGKELGLLD
jgi:phosphonate transport system substrate-binding protein